MTHTHTHTHTQLAVIVVGFELPSYTFDEPSFSQRQEVCMTITSGRLTSALTVGVNWEPETAMGKEKSVCFIQL